MHTFLFTDIEGHSALWDSHPTAMASALREHDQLVASAVTATGGRVVKTAGDGVMAVFDDAGGAVGAAVSIQRTLVERQWADIGRLHVRMGLHVGSADTRDNDYFGPEVIRAARLCHAANGGQIVASRAVVELVPEQSWLPLGLHRLRGLATPTEIHQVVADGIGDRFPALRTVDAHPNTLPRFRTGFIGREDEITSLRAALRDHRLVTLTGIGGTGKTRLAVEVAHELLGSFPDGVYFADLSAVTEADRVWEALAAALELDRGGTMRAGEPPQDLVLRFLKTRRALVVLDNCEHLLEPSADVAEAVLDASDGVTVLATSREGLHVEGEWMVQVPSLEVRTDALRLFRDRAAASGATDVDDGVAGGICERLDGLPLAIELAAARCAQLGADEVAARLSDRFRLLTGSRRRVPRQRTLEAALDWSHDLLTSAEQSALRRMAIFEGSFSLAAAESVALADIDLMGSLVDKSLVQRVEDGRFRLLETMRAYGAQRLVDAGEAESIRQDLLDWLLREIDSFSDEEVVFRGDRSDRFLKSEIGNLLSAMAWAADGDDWATVARLASYAGLAGGLTGDVTYRPVVAFVHAALDHGLAGPLRDRALAAHTVVGYIDATHRTRVDLWEEVGARALLGDDGVAVVSLVWVANTLDAWSRAAGTPGGIERAQQLLVRASATAQRLGEDWEALPALLEAILALNAGDWSRAADGADRAIAIREASQFGGPIAFEFFIQATARLAAGRPFTADELLRRARGVADLDLMPAVDVHLTAYSAPDPTTKRQPIVVDRRALDGGHYLSVSSFLISTAALAARELDWPMAARLLAAASSAGGIFAGGADVALYRITVPQVRAALPKPTRDALITESREVGTEHAVDLAIRWLAME